MLRAAALTTAILTLTAAPVLASTPDTGGKPWDDPGESPVSITKTAKLIVKEIPELGKLVLEDERTGQLHNVKLNETVALKARSKRQFDGRKKLGFNDLEVGQRLKITYRADSGEILKILVLDKKAVAAA